VRLRTIFRTLVIALFSSGVAFATGKTVDEATPADRAEAGNIYAAAMADFDHNDLQKALAGFRDSYGKVKSPNSHFMIARTMARLGQNAEAYAELERVVAEAEALGGRYADTVQAAHAKMDEIRPRVGFVVVTPENAPKGTSVLVGEETLPAEKVGKPVAVLPGDNKITVVTPNGREERTVTVAAGDTKTVSIDLGATAPVEAVEPEIHQPYRLEVEAAVIGEVTNPPGGTNRGAGIGGRVAVPILPRLILGNRDNLAICAGADYSWTSADRHVWIPVVAQWNIWITSDFSARLEPGVALVVGNGTYVRPAGYLGLRYRVYRHLYITGRVGVPDATIGASLFL
jgi:hypothetical protein